MTAHLIAPTARRGAHATAVALAALLISSGVIAHPTQAQDYTGGEYLQARLYEPLGGQLQFTVSRPAYVAIFEVLPGSGMTMLHPWTSYGTQRRMAGGQHSFVPRRRSFNRNSYAFTGYSRYSSPIVLLLIASERPLRLERLPRAPTALMNHFGFASYHPAATFDAVERLAARIVPDSDYTDWTYDTYIIWPESHTPVLAMHPVLCADGQVRFIVGGRLPLDCLKPAATTEPDSAKAPRDSSKGRVRRAPQQTRDWSGEKRAVERTRSRGTATGTTRKPSSDGAAPARPSGASPATGSAGGRKPDASSPGGPARPAPAPAPQSAPSGGEGRGTRASEVPAN